MGKILRRPQFIEDVRDVWHYIARDSEFHADRFIRDLEKRYTLLSRNPHLGAARFRRYPGIRIFPYRNYVIIYEPMVDDSGIELIRLLHAARDYRRYFDD